MYTEEQNGLANFHAVAADADDLSGAAVHTTFVPVMAQMKVKVLEVLVSVVTVGACTIAFKRRPLFGSTSGEVTMGSVIVPAATAAGKVVYKKLASPVTCFPGDQIVYEITSAATSGNAHYGVTAELDPEEPSNQSDMIASA